MPAYRTNLFLTAAMALLFLPGPAQSAELLNGLDREALVRAGRIDELHILESRQRRREFQLQQQLYREQDRAVVRPRSRALKVPVMPRNCQIQLFGNSVLRTCR